MGCVLLVGIIACACYLLVVGPRDTYHVHFLICFLAQHFLGACFAGGTRGLWECVEESAQGLRTFQGWQRGTATPPEETGSWPGFRTVCLSTHHSRTLSVEHCEWAAGFLHLFYFFKNFYFSFGICSSWSLIGTISKL